MTGSAPLPPPDAALPKLPAAFDGDAIAAAITRHWPPAIAGEVTVAGFEPTWLRYKPDASCVVRGALTFERGRERGADPAAGAAPSAPTWATVTLYADDRARTVARDGGSLARLAADAYARHGGPKCRHAHLADLDAVLQLAPVDRRVPWLVEATAPGAAARLLGRSPGPDIDPASLDLDLIRHVPERKAVLRIAARRAGSCGGGDPDGALAYAKIHARRDAAALAGLQRDLVARGLPVGALLAVDAHLHATVVAAVPGTTLRALRAAGAATVAPLAAASVTALGRLHALDDACRAAGGLARRTGPHEADAVVAAATYLDRLGDGRWGAGRLAERIAAALADAPWRARVVHGDWYDRQVLAGPSGLRLIDFDEAALGDPALDFGTFMAHYSAWAAVTDVGGDRAAAAEAAATAEAARAAVVSAVSGRDAMTARLSTLYEAAALVRLAVHPFRRLDPAWPDACAAVLAVAERRLDAFLGRRRRGSASADPIAPPFDPALPTLALAVSLDRMSAALASLGRPAARVTSADVVRHKPGRRCLLRYGVEDEARPSSTVLYGKVFASARGPRVLAAHAGMYAALSTGRTALEPRVPEPIGFAAEAGVVLLGAVPGVPVTARLLAGDVALAARIGSALGALHGAAVGLERVHRPADELAPLEARVARLAAADGRLGDRAALALERLEAAKPGDRAWRRRPVHRDLHPDQVLAGANDAIGLVDLDDAALSEPALDVGNFVAHLIWLGGRAPSAAGALRRVAGAFQRAHAATDANLSAAVVRWCQAAALLRLADVHLAAGGPPLAGALVTAALARLAAGDGADRAVAGAGDAVTRPARVARIQWSGRRRPPRS